MISQLVDVVVCENGQGIDDLERLYYWLDKMLNGKSANCYYEYTDEVVLSRDSHDKIDIFVLLSNKIVKNLRTIGITSNHKKKYFHICFSEMKEGRASTKNEVQVGVLVETFLNPNSLHLLTNGDVTKYRHYTKKLMLFKEKIMSLNKKISDYVIVSSGVLGIYGMREPTDIDMVTVDDTYNEVCDEIIDCHHHVLNTYGITAESLIYDPHNYVYWNKIKFASLDVVKRACCSRKQRTKKIDGIFIDALLNNSRSSPYLNLLKIEHWLLRNVREFRKKEYVISLEKKISRLNTIPHRAFRLIIHPISIWNKAKGVIMEKKVVKIKFVDYWPNHHLNEDILYKWLKAHYIVELSDEPQYVIYSCFGYEHLKYNCIRIFYTGENVAPDFNECDYAISFEDIVFGDRHLKMPNFFKYKDSIDEINNTHGKQDSDYLLNRKFCNYVFSNGNAAQERSDIFDKLSMYKMVDSGGNFRNNIGYRVEDKLSFQKGYKFSIAYENNSHKGYTTEKILQAFAANTIPIYWGDPCVSEYFNEKAFINANDYSNNDELIKRIIDLDNDDDKYLEMVNEPVWSSPDIYQSKMDQLDSFMDNIFSKELAQAYRRNTSAISKSKEKNTIVWKAYYESAEKKEKEGIVVLLKKKIKQMIGK